MSQEKAKPTGGKKTDAKAKPTPVPAAKAAAATPEPPPGPVAPLFNRVDWLTFAITSLLVFLGYYWTLAPDLTLEDSGELAVGSFYAGVPHPPGYPVWTIFTWLVCELVPVSNIAWRVALASAIQGALACGFIGMMVSRGSAMIIGGFENLRGIEPRIEKAICVVCGYVAGMLMGFNGYLWSQAVIVEVYAISVLSLTGCMIFLMRWMHAPHQRKYLYWSVFWLGICFTNHQTLLVAAIGIEVAVLARDVRLGRDVFFGNCVIFAVFGLLLMFRYGGAAGLATSGLNLAYIKAFVVIGLVSMVVTAWLFIQTGAKLGTEWKPAIMMLIMWVLGASFYFYMPLAGLSTPPMQWGYPRTVEGFMHALTRGQYEKGNPTSGLDRFFGQLQTYVEGSIEEMNIVYLFIALIPLAIIFYRRIEPEEKVWLGAASGLYAFVCLFKLATHFAEFRPVVLGMIYGYLFLLIGIIPFLFLRHAGGRAERSWLAGLTTIFLFLSLMLIYLLNPPPDRQSQQLNRVFFTASYVPVAMCVGYGLALIAAAAVAQYARFRRVLLAGCAIAAAVAWVALDDLRVEYPLAIFTAQFALGLAVAGILLFAVCRTRVPLALMLVLFAVMPAHTILSHWAENEQRGHLFGFWFGHDMFTPPFEDSKGNFSYDRKEREAALKDPARAKFTYPEMAPHTILYGGTDPGRFCPTYMIFCESFIKPEQRRNPDFDRRDVYIITQNALADATYLMYIRSHYNRSTQKDPPFFAGLVDHLQGLVLKKTERAKRDRGIPYQMGALGRLIGLGEYLAKPLDWLFGERIGAAIERDRRAGTSLFKPEHFTKVKELAGKLQPGPQQDALSQWLHEQLAPDTRALLTGADESALRKALAKDFNRLIEREMPERWKVFEDLHRIYQEHEEAARKVQETSNDPQAQLAIQNLKVAREQAMQTRRNEFFASPAPFYSTNRFAGVKLDARLQRFAKQDLTWATIRLNRLLLEAAYPDAIAKSEGGVYPDLEMRIASPEDSSKAFTDYVEDARKRLEHDMKAPNEPRQIRPGEDVKYDEATGRIQVSGQVAVMSINGLLTKVMFDKNPGHEFYVEESFPLDWMYPHLAPSGIIMKINREPLPEMTQEIVDRDHRFWSKYSERLIGNWITHDTTVSNICEFAEQAYVRRNLKSVKVAGKEVFPDARFVRDDDAQKAFSKLRSAIAGVYFWRINEAGRRGNLAEQQRMIKECDFAFRQAFAFCPFSPEAVFRYTNLLISLGKIDDALMIARTFQKLDPNNRSARDLIDQLMDIRGKVGAGAPMQTQLAQAQVQLAQLEAAHRANPADAGAGLQLVAAYVQMRQTNAAVATLDILAQAGSNELMTLVPVLQAYAQIGQPAKSQQTIARLFPLAEQILANPQSDTNRLQAALQAYQLVAASQPNNAPAIQGMENSLHRLLQHNPASPELWYDLGALLSYQDQTNAALQAVSNAVHHSNARLKKTPGSQDLRALATSDGRFNALRPSAEFQKIVAPK
ncbi:MAG: protein O-mannosyl-transferase family [Limisphaerales bacterium]